MRAVIATAFEVAGFLLAAAAVFVAVLKAGGLAAALVTAGAVLIVEAALITYSDGGTPARDVAGADEDGAIL